MTARILASWAEYQWPDWVPQSVRDSIESFWSLKAHRDHHEWEEGRLQNKAPQLGEYVWMESFRSSSARRIAVYGRYVYCWNNVGRIITDDGTVEYVAGRVLDAAWWEKYGERARLYERAERMPLYQQDRSLWNHLFSAIKNLSDDTLERLVQLVEQGTPQEDVQQARRAQLVAHMRARWITTHLYGGFIFERCGFCRVEYEQGRDTHAPGCRVAPLLVA